MRGEDWQKVAEKLDLQIKAGQWPKATLGELDSQVYNGNPEQLGRRLLLRGASVPGVLCPARGRGWRLHAAASAASAAAAAELAEAAP